MDSDSEDLIILNPSNVRRLHPDFPMDTTAGRFKRNIQKQIKRLREATDQLGGAWSRFEFSHNEGDQQIARNAKTEVQGIRLHVIRLKGEAGMEGDEESDAAIKSANGELARLGNSLETAALVLDRAPIITSTVPTNLAGDGFWEPVSNSPPPNPDRVAHTTSTHDSIIIDTVPNSLNSLQVEAEVNDERLNRSTNPPPPAATIASSFQQRSRPASSVASSQKDLRIAQNEAARIARLTRSRVDEEELELDEQEAADAAKLTMEAARIAADSAHCS
jgi:hypothetical protein